MIDQSIYAWEKHVGYRMQYRTMIENKKKCVGFFVTIEGDNSIANLLKIVSVQASEEMKSNSTKISHMGQLYI
jgi:hypothetical protein